MDRQPARKPVRRVLILLDEKGIFCFAKWQRVFVRPLPLSGIPNLRPRFRNRQTGRAGVSNSDCTRVMALFVVLSLKVSLFMSQ